MTVNLSSLAGAGWQLFSNNGIPLSGGLLYTYAAGTSTPLATYTSNSGSIANSNPIVLDSSGRVPYEIWLTPGSTYKFVLNDANNNSIGSYDNISGINDLSGSSGATLIGFKQGNSSGFYGNAVTSTVAKKLQDFVSVIDFGADPTGTNDSTTAIQNAVNASQAVFFPEGKYKITSTITLNQYNWLWSKGADIESIQTSNGVNCIVTTNDCTIEGLTFNLYGTSVTSGIKVLGNNIQIINCNFYTNINVAIYLYTCSNVLIDSNYFNGVSYGVLSAVGNNFTFQGIVFSNNIGYQLYADMFNINTDTNGTTGIIAKDITVIGNVCNQVGALTSATTETRFCAFIHATNVTISGNAIYGTSGDSAIHFEGAANTDIDDSVTIIGNVFRDCISAYSRFIWIVNTGGYRHCVISNNTFEVTSATSSIGTSVFFGGGGSAPLSGDMIFSNNIFRYRRSSGDTSTIYGTALNLAFAVNAIVTSNEFVNLSTAISADDAGSIQISNNRFNSCGYGVYANNASYSFTGIISHNVFISSVTYDLNFAKSTFATINNNIFTSYALSSNNNQNIYITSCRDNVNANFGRQQTITNATKANAYCLGYVDGDVTNFLINGIAEYQPNSANYFSSLEAINGRNGTVTQTQLNSNMGLSIITGLTYTFSASCLYVTVSASSGASSGDISIQVDIL